MTKKYDIRVIIEVTTQLAYNNSWSMRRRNNRKKTDMSASRVLMYVLISCLTINLRWHALLLIFVRLLESLLDEYLLKRIQAYSNFISYEFTYLQS